MTSLAERRNFRSYGWFQPRKLWRDAPLGLLLATLLFVTVIGVGTITGLYDVRAYAGLKWEFDAPWKERSAGSEHFGSKSLSLLTSAATNE